MKTSTPAIASASEPASPARLVRRAISRLASLRPVRPACTTPCRSHTATSPIPAATSILAIALPAAPAPEITARRSAGVRPVSAAAPLSAASVTTAVPCWSSWKTGMSSRSCNRRSISKQRGAEMSSRLTPPKDGASRTTVSTISSTSVVASAIGTASTPPRLHVTIGRISQTIKKLERYVGAPLFERTNRSVRLTPLGHRLHEDLRPGYEQIRAGLDHAINSVRQTRTALRVGFVGAAAGQIAHQTRDLFPERKPECPVHVREAQIIDAVARLREGDVDVLVLSLPISGPDLVIGPVLISEPRMLAAPTGHTLARRKSVTMEDLADIPLLRLAGALPGDWPSDRWPERTPGGRAVPGGPSFETFQEALQLIAAGSGGCIVGAQVTRFYARPDVAFIPFSDAPPIDWAPVWLKSNNTPLIRAFARTAQEVASRIYLAATHQ